MDLLEDHLYVAQNKTRAFLKPTISSENIDDEVIEKWLSMSQTLQDWSRTFRLAKTTLESEAFATRDKLATHKISMRSAREYKTPRKEVKDDGFDDKPPSFYNSFVPDAEGSSTAQVETFMEHIGKTFLGMHKEILKLHTNQTVLEDRINKG